MYASEVEADSGRYVAVAFAIVRYVAVLDAVVRYELDAAIHIGSLSVFTYASEVEAAMNIGSVSVYEVRYAPIG